MPVGLRRVSGTGAGLDFDSIFDPYVSGTKAAACGYRDAAGVDIVNRYAPISLGTKAANVGHRIVTGPGVGTDVSNLFAAIGTAQYSLPFDGDTFSAHSSGNVSSAMTSTITTAINAAGTYAVTTVANNIRTANISGTWLPSGESASDYQVQFVVTQTSQRTNGPATITNGAAAYAACTTNRQVQATVAVGQSSAFDKGGAYTVVVNLKKISTGAVQTTTHYYNLSSIGTG